MPCYRIHKKKTLKEWFSAVTVTYRLMIYDTCGSTQNSIRHPKEFLLNLTVTLYCTVYCNVQLNLRDADLYRVTQKKREILKTQQKLKKSKKKKLLTEIEPLQLAF